MCTRLWKWDRMCAVSIKYTYPNIRYTYRHHYTHCSHKYSESEQCRRTGLTPCWLPCSSSAATATGLRKQIKNHQIFPNIVGPQWMNPNDFGEPLISFPPLWRFFLLCLDKYWLDYHKLWCTHSSLSGQLVITLLITQMFSFPLNVSTFFNIWPYTCETNNISISLSCTLCMC